MVNHVGFDSGQWEATADFANRWWDGESQRPLIQVRLSGAPTDLPKPRLPFHDFTSLYDLSIPASEIMDAWDYELATTKHLGDAYPTLRPNFGATVITALLGADLINGADTAWFHVDKTLPLEECVFEYDPDNVWFRRVKDVCRAAVERFAGRVQIGMTDLASPLDLLSIFRGTDNLMLDLYDDPETVAGIIDQLHRLWWRYFDEIDAILRPANPGYNGWDLLFSPEPYYISQCDLSYMLGPEMYEQFVRPELERTYAKMTNTFYHMDGPGQRASFEIILAMKGLKGIQWVPGEGAPDVSQWPDLYRKIHDAGKRIQVIGSHYMNDPAILDILQEQIGDVSGVALTLWGDVSEEERFRAALARWGV